MRKTVCKNIPRLALFAFLSATCGLQAQLTHELSSNAHVKQFRVAGPFHQEGLQPDHFAELMEIEFIDNESRFGVGQDKHDSVVAEIGPGDSIDFNKVLGESEIALAYAQFEVQASKEAEVLFLVSAADGAKIYLNGESVHASFGGMGPNYLHFFANVHEGKNNVVIKVPNRDWGWRLSVRILDEERAASYLETADEEIEYQKFLHSNLEIRTGGGADPRFRPGRFPALVFENPQLVKKYLGGSHRIRTRWFDGDLVEVDYPKKPGRYAYYAEINGANGITLKKSATLICSEDWRGQFQRLDSKLGYIAINDIPESTWKAHGEAIGEFSGSIMQSSMMLQKEGAVLLAFAEEVNKQKLKPGPRTTPLILNGDYHARLKQKILGVENKYPKLKRPAPFGKKAPVLTNLSESQAEEYEDLRSELVEAANRWMEDGGAPFDILVALRGDIIFHGSFGQDYYGRFTTETPTEIASITKLLTGVLFAQFVDQGIIGIDDPVGLYLPEFPLTGPNAVTMRHCFTHTSGFYGHALFDGVHNPWLENTLALVIKDDTVGQEHRYNGMGYNLAGKVMEVVTGKSVFRLFREYLYDPLEMNDTVHDWDLGFSCQSTAHDLAKVGQLLLNGGSYGNLQFFSPETLEKILPKDLNEFYPGVNRKWGIGINFQDRSGLISDNVIGHGSATSNTFWVVPEHDLVITQTRRRGNRNFGPNFRNVIGVIKKHLIEN